jgi:hypothetical protein
VWHSEGIQQAIQPGIGPVTPANGTGILVTPQQTTSYVLESHAQTGPCTASSTATVYVVQNDAAGNPFTFSFQCDVAPGLQSWHLSLPQDAVSPSVLATGVMAVGCSGGSGWPESSLIYNAQQAFNVVSTHQTPLPHLPLAGDWRFTPIGGGNEYRLTQPACFLFTLDCR